MRAQAAKDRATYLGKKVGRRLVWGPSDLLHRGDGDELTPPRHLSFVGRGDFHLTGNEFVDHFAQVGQLQPTDDVLDIGCGIGRMAIPLTGYLTDGTYAGFDVGRDMIRWCQRHVTARHPNFSFEWAPVFNRKYNPFGDVDGGDYRFPYPDGSFDFVFATSLFTHLLPDVSRHYLAETRRVLRPSGRCLLTFFLLDEWAEREIANGSASLDFRFEVDGGLTSDEVTPEEAIALRIGDAEAMFAEAGLLIEQPVHFGQWANRPDGVAGQDMIVATPRP